MQYNYLPVNKVHYGIDVIKDNLHREINKIGAKRILIVTTNSLTEKESYRELFSILNSNHILVVKAAQHVPSDFLMEQMKEVFQFNPEIIISFGGGSAIDAAKIITLILTENITSEESLFQYSANIRLKHARFQNVIPHFSIPTTLSAAEFTCIAGVTNREDQVKYGFSHPRLTPVQVFLDPSYTLETPEWLWLSTGIRAVDHAVETLYSPRRNPINVSLALKSLEHLVKGLPLTKANPNSLDHRLHCQLGAWMSLFSNNNVKLGLSHSIGHQLGSHFEIPHGYTSAIMLPFVMEFLAPITHQEQAQIYDVLVRDQNHLNTHEKAKEAAGIIRDLVIELDIPYLLRDFHVSKDRLSEVVAGIVMDIKAENNPLVIKIDRLEEALLALLEKAW